MSIHHLISKIKSQPEEIDFAEVISAIEAHYDYTPTAFRNGETMNEAGSNEGSCKIFAFAQLNQLSPAETLACFGKYYREDVLGNPTGSDHANIRNFMQSGWTGVQFDQAALSAK